MKDKSSVQLSLYCTGPLFKISSLTVCLQCVCVCVPHFMDMFTFQYVTLFLLLQVRTVQFAICWLLLCACVCVIASLHSCECCVHVYLCGCVTCRCRGGRSGTSCQILISQAPAAQRYLMNSAARYCLLHSAGKSHYGAHLHHHLPLY